MELNLSDFVPVTPAPNAICMKAIHLETPFDEEIMGIQLFISQGELVEFRKDPDKSIKPTFLREQPELEGIAVFHDHMTLWLSQEAFAESFVPLPKEPPGLAYCSLEEATNLGVDDLMVFDFKSKTLLQVGSLARDPSFNPSVAEAFHKKYNMENYGATWIGLTEYDK